MTTYALVVEDNAANQRVIAALLQALDFEITYANNGVEALECVAAKQFDVILMDIHMPLMDGFEATKRIRELGDWCDVVPIIAVSSDVIADDRNIYINAGLTDMVPKPINSRLFATTVLKHLSAS